MSDPFPASLCLDLPSPQMTADLAAWFAPRLRAGDVLLLSGEIGAGKTHFARALIQARLLAEGRYEDVPSPTFTLVQSYATSGPEIWHADLYRLTDPSEIWELGLEDAFRSAICLVEWPERMGKAVPKQGLYMRFLPGSGPDDRRITVSTDESRWAPILAGLARWPSVP